MLLKPQEAALSFHVTASGKMNNEAGTRPFWREFLFL
jgi:hypothetical protein